MLIGGAGEQSIRCSGLLPLAYRAGPVDLASTSFSGVEAYEEGIVVRRVDATTSAPSLNRRSTCQCQTPAIMTPSDVTAATRPSVAAIATSSPDRRALAMATGVAGQGVSVGSPQADTISSRSRIVRNMSTLGVSQVFTWMSSAGLAVLLPQQLGDQNLGKFATAASLTDLCSLLTSLGMTGYLIKVVAQQEMGARSQILNALAMRVPLTVVASAIAVISASLLGYDLLTSQIVYLLCLNFSFAAFSTVLEAAFHGMQEMRPAALIGAASKIMLLGLVAIALYLGYGIIGVMVAYNIVGGVTLITYLSLARRLGVLGGELNFRIWRVIFIGSLPFFTWQSAHMIYAQVDVILLAQFTRDAVVGWYGAAYRIVSIPVFIPTIIAAAVYPALSRTARFDVAEFKLIAQRSVRTVLLMTIPIALGTIVTGERLIEFFRYPEEFRRSVPLIMILATHMPLVGISTILGFILVARDRQQTLALCGIAAAVLNPSLNLLLIPYYHAVFDNGAIGAAFATLATELFMTAMSLWLLRGTILGWPDLIFGARCLASGLLMSGVVWLMLDFFLPLTVLVGAIVYASSSWAVGTLTAQDIRTLLMYVSRRRATTRERVA